MDRMSLAEELEERQNDCLDRMATALETIAGRMEDPNAALIARLAECQDILRDFIALMANADSTNADWDDLLEDVHAALGTPA
jgi:hypothetical protein